MLQYRPSAKDLSLMSYKEIKMSVSHDPMSSVSATKLFYNSLDTQTPLVSFISVENGVILAKTNRVRVSGIDADSYPPYVIREKQIQCKSIFNAA